MRRPNQTETDGCPASPRIGVGSRGNAAEPHANPARPGGRRLRLGERSCRPGFAVRCSGALGLFQRSLIYPGAFIAGPRARLPVPPGTRALSLLTADDERLHALWRAPRPGCGVVVSFHGNGSRPEPHAARFSARAWSAAGWGVLAIAYRGYPGSTGAPSEDGLIARRAGGGGRPRGRAPGAPILLHGHSLGAAVAVAVAERVPHLGLYLEAPFDSLTGIVRLAFPYAPTLLLRDTWRSDARIARAGGPVLIVHGTEDASSRCKLGRRLATAAGQGARFEAVPATTSRCSVPGTAQAEAMFGGFPSRSMPDACRSDAVTPRPGFAPIPYSGWRGCGGRRGFGATRTALARG